MPLYDFKCTNEECGHEFEGLAKPTTKADKKCPLCGSSVVDVPAAFAHWCPSKERTNQQLKKRSEDHTKRKFAMGGEEALKENDSYRRTTDDWHSKTRSKNTSKGVIEKYQNLHKNYTPGTSPL